MEPYGEAKRQYLKTFYKYTIARCYYNEYRNVTTPHGHDHVKIESLSDHHSGGNSIGGTHIKHESLDEDDDHVRLAQSDHDTEQVSENTVNIAPKLNNTSAQNMTANAKDHNQVTDDTGSESS
ncbi:hypothetical protein D6D05_05219 [Aureobasidium pullulans]|nr:hypothetical protein D6D05_05219 [Aureobasidium pullulans]